MQRESLRKSIHAATVVAAPWVLLVPRPWSWLALALVTALFLGLDVWRLRSAPAAARLARRLPGVYRPDENRTLSGAFTLLLGYTTVAALFAARPAAAGIVAVALGDAAAALVGRAWASRGRRSPTGRRTAVGSLACFVTAGAAVGVVLGWRPVPVLAAAATATVLERLAPRCLDNLAIPIGVALVSGVVDTPRWPL
jgi:dolichol kinase